jgi:hypothetical protein
LRVHGESVNPDNTPAINSDTGLRYAYSRLDFQANRATDADT